MKKVLNIFAVISLITAGASSMVACGSHHNPNPPKSESQKLFDKLNETKIPFLIKNDYFWGNEANYQNDLLTDLEQAAQITSQEDKNLLHDANVKPLTQRDGQSVDIQSVDINIDGIKDPAIVKIKWELTSAQKTPGLYKFYTQYWPQETAKYGSNLLSLFYGGWDTTKKSPFWKQGDPLGWWKNDKGSTINNHLSWDDNLNTKIKNYLSTLIEGMQIPASIQNILHVVKPSKIEDLAITKSYNIPLEDIYLLSDGVKYNLGYYSSYHSTKSLPQMQNWNISYNTGYNLIQNELSHTKTIKLLKNGLNPPYTASNNSGYIKDKIQYADYGIYSSFVADLRFRGNFKMDGTKSSIEVYYYDLHHYFDLGFTIKVEVLDF